MSRTQRVRLALQPVTYPMRNLLRHVGLEITPVDLWHPAPTLDAHLSTLFSHLQVGCVLDVGANRGQYGRRLRRNGYKGKIISFEPVAASFAGLTAERGRDSDWFVHNYALGSASDRREINIPSTTELSSFRRPNDFQREVLGEQSDVRATEVVQIEMLDDVLDGCISAADAQGAAVYLKLDTQGWDNEVLAGATTSLSTVVALQSEMSVRPIYEGAPDYLESIRHLNQLGFSVSGMFPVSVAPDLTLIEFDCVLVRAGRSSGG